MRGEQGACDSHPSGLTTGNSGEVLGTPDICWQQCTLPSLQGLNGQTVGSPDQLQICLQQLWLHLLHLITMHHPVPPLIAGSLRH